MELPARVISVKVIVFPCQHCTVAGETTTFWTDTPKKSATNKRTNKQTVSATVEVSHKTKGTQQRISPCSSTTKTRSPAQLRERYNGTTVEPSRRRNFAFSHHQCVRHDCSPQKHIFAMLTCPTSCSQLPKHKGTLYDSCAAACSKHDNRT